MAGACITISQAHMKMRLMEEAERAYIEPFEQTRAGYEPFLELDNGLEFEPLPSRGNVLDEGFFPAGEERDVEHRALWRSPPSNCARQVPCIHLVHLHDIVKHEQICLPV